MDPEASDWLVDVKDLRMRKLPSASLKYPNVVDSHRPRRLVGAVIAKEYLVK